MMLCIPILADMVLCMKTTIEISDPLLKEAKKLLHEENTTLRALVEEGLRDAIEKRKAKKRRFRLRKASFKGKGLQPDFQGASWETIRSAAYKGHGG